MAVTYIIHQVAVQQRTNLPCVDFALGYNLMMKECTPGLLFRPTIKTLIY